MLAYVSSAALHGIEATPVKVEVDVLSRGLPGFSMVGLLETAVKEARDRVGSAIRNAGFALPNRKTVINLSPADIKKSGAHYDLSIAIGLLIAAGVCRPANAAKFMIVGELSLTGQVLPVNGILLMALSAKEQSLCGIIVPAANAWEASLAADEKLDVIAVENIAQAVDFLNEGELPPLPRPREPGVLKTNLVDLSEVRGQPFAKRGLEIAAAGGHNIALKGPPGTGKTMLAERLPSILPPLSGAESIEVAKIMSWHGLLKGTSDVPSERPFRAPHHSASYVGLIGGGAGGNPRLGEISLAHMGVLFLDEMSEFRRDVIEVLRQPMESGEVRIVRAGISLRYPARFMLVAAFNPCRCGYFGHPTRQCVCSFSEIRKYRAKLSGPMLDRIDLHVVVGPPPHDALIDEVHEESSAAIRERVMEARKKQAARYGRDDMCNSALSGRNIAKHCPLGREEKTFLRAAAQDSGLSARALHRVLKVSRTIADLEGAPAIRTGHIAEAMQFRPSLDELE